MERVVGGYLAAMSGIRLPSRLAVVLGLGAFLAAGFIWPLGFFHCRGRRERAFAVVVIAAAVAVLAIWRYGLYSAIPFARLDEISILRIPAPTGRRPRRPASSPPSPPRPPSSTPAISRSDRSRSRSAPRWTSTATWRSPRGSSPSTLTRRAAAASRRSRSRRGRCGSCASTTGFRPVNSSRSRGRMAEGTRGSRTRVRSRSSPSQSKAPAGWSSAACIPISTRTSSSACPSGR